jgi:hypothetical protein
MNTESRILRWSVIIGIVIVLNLFFNYAISLVYERPDYEAFCPQTQVVTIPDNQDQCVAEGGQWTNNTYYETRPAPVGVVEKSGYCDLQYTCREEFQSATDTYSRNVFVILVLLGALSVLLGNFLKGNEVISIGLALAGVLSFLIASVRYWGSANDLVRLIILAIALGILFWVAWKKFNDRLQS